MSTNPTQDKILGFVKSHGFECSANLDGTCIVAIPWVKMDAHRSGFGLTRMTETGIEYTAVRTLQQAREVLGY